MISFEKLPIEVQEMMLVQQHACGNPKNPDIFKKDIIADTKVGGFTWSKAQSPKILNEREKHNFWERIIRLGELKEFHRIYGKIETIEQNGEKFVV